MRTILHVDMDAFYASVEQRDDPSLRGRPVIVGGSRTRGVVCAASYEARPFGVRSAMPMARAVALCPQATVLVPRMDRYAEVSREVFAIFHRFTPLVEGLSLDEAFLDVTGSRSLFGDGEAIARAIRSAIRSELGLAASAGVAPSKFVAKVASDLAKPDGVLIVADNVRAFLAPLPVERMWGVGPKAARLLRERGIVTLGTLADAPEVTLTRVLGKWAPVARGFAMGLDDRPVVPDRKAKSIGAETTHDADLTSWEDLSKALLAHAERATTRLRRAKLSSRSVVVKLKYRSFRIVTRSELLREPVDDCQSVHAAAMRALARLDWAAEPVRLTGLSLGHLQDGPPAPSLFQEPTRDHSARVDRVADQIRERFGAEGLMRAALLPVRARNA